MQNRRRHTSAFAAILAVGALTAPASALAQGAAPPAPSGGASPDDPALRPPGKATLAPGGVAIAPPDAPPAVVGAINAANAISNKPYRYGGGHAKGFADTAYDCSGAVSAALAGGGLLTAPLHSTLFMKWGDPGPGRWITVYSNPGHAYMEIAGLRFDTGGRDRRFGRRAQRLQVAPGSGPRWGGRRSSAGYVARHPAGL